MKPKQCNSFGFTLLEVLIAMTLLSIMVTLLFSSLKVGAESWNKGETKIAEVNEKAVVYQFFKRYFPGIKPLWDDFSTEGERLFSFQGATDSLQFVSVFPSSAGRKGMQYFSINYDENGGNGEGILRVKLKPFYPAKDETEWESESVILLEKIESFTLRYFNKEELKWVDDWEEKQYLPALIKVHITLVNESYWPEMVFELKLSSENKSEDIDGMMRP